METFALISGNLIGGVICLVIGLVLRTGKASSLIAGYNTMSAEEQARWNEVAMSRFVGWMLIIPSILLLVGCVPILFDFYPIIILIITWGIFTAVIIAGVIYLNTSRRFKRGR